MAKHNGYGSFDSSDVASERDKEEAGRSSSDTMRSQGRGGERPDSAHGRRKEDVEMHPLADQAAIPEDSDGDSDSGSDESAQAGVKRAEAISTTWTTTGLYAAYLGCVLPFR